MTLNAAQKDNLKLLQTTLIKALNQQIEEIRESDIYESTISHQFCDEVTIRACSNRNLEYIEKKTGDGKELDHWLVYSHLVLSLYYQSKKKFSLDCLMVTINVLLTLHKRNTMSKETIAGIIKYKIQPQIGERYPDDFEKWVRALSIQLKSR